MRLFYLFLPVALMAQTPAPQTPSKTPSAPAAKAPATPAAPAPKPAVPSVARPAAPRPAGAIAPKPAAPPALTTDDQKTVYALGLSLARSIETFDLSPAEMELVKRALTDAAAKKPAIVLEEWGPKIQPLVMARTARVAEKQKVESATFCSKAATEPGAVKADSGLIYREVRAGTGESPKATDTVKVNYRGTLINGTEFDSSYKRNEPAQFALNRVIPCWTEGVQKMKPGGKSVLVCPSSIAYGDQGQPPVIPGGAALIFEIELLNVGGADK